MRKLARLPSSHYPDYLKLDLGVGLPEANPLARALDDAMTALSERALAAAWRMRPEQLPAARVRAHLEGLGFATAALDDDECLALFDAREDILVEPGALASLHALAGIYLGVCEVRRGRPIVASPLAAGGVRELVLQDTVGGGDVVFVRTGKTVSEARREAFRRSCRRLLPEGFSVVIAPATRARVVAPTGFDLSGAVRLRERRL